MVCLLAGLIALAGCAGNGGGGGDGETTDTATTEEMTKTAENESGAGENDTMGNETMTMNGTNVSAESNFLFNSQLVNVSANGTVTGENETFLGNVTIVDDNQQGGDGFFDVQIYQNGTVVNDQGEVVGEVEIEEVCPTPSQNSEFFLNGDTVDVSGANGDVLFDNGDDTFIDVTILEDNQGQEEGFQNVQIATNGSVVNQEGEVVGQVQMNQNCAAANAQS